MSSGSETYDCIVAGAGFAGLACAIALGRRGFSVRVLERKARVDEKLRTTGIVVKEAVDRISVLDCAPASLFREILAVRLYAPNMHSFRLEAPDCYFLATDTAGLMRWLAAQAREAGAELVFGSGFHAADGVRGGWDLGARGRCRFLIGADGTRSAVAAVLGLGVNKRLLHGMEQEYELGPDGPSIGEPDALHCFLDRRLAPGYIAWVLEGVGLLQAGLARRNTRGGSVKAALEQFIEKIAPLVRLADHRPVSVRAGPIPCGGLVRPLAGDRSVLVGDAAGMVSPLTAGGIHTALRHGLDAGHAVADFLDGRSPDPASQIVRRYPRFWLKRLLRLAFDHLQSDWLLNSLLATPAMRVCARRIYFHR